MKVCPPLLFTGVTRESVPLEGVNHTDISTPVCVSDELSLGVFPSLHETWTVEVSSAQVVLAWICACAYDVELPCRKRVRVLCTAHPYTAATALSRRAYSGVPSRCTAPAPNNLFR